MKLHIKQALIILILLIKVFPALAQEGTYGSAGLKSVYTKDDYTSLNYYKPFAKLGWAGEVIDLSASYYRWISYSINDAVFNTTEININQPEAELTVYAGDVLSMSGGYSFMSGSSSYTAHRFTAGFVLDFESIDISVDSSIRNTEYQFNGTIKNSAVTAGGEISFDINDCLSWDAGYQHEYTDYETFGYTYTKNIFRLGIVAVPVKKMFFLAGISGGEDSDKTKTGSLDAGLTLKLFDHLKLSAAYMLTVDFVTSSSTSTKMGRRGTSSSTTTSKTETYISHTGNFEISTFF